MAIRFKGFSSSKTASSRKRPRSIKPVVRYDYALDENRRYLTDNPTPERMANWLRAVDQGDIAALTEIDDEMIAKDAHLMGVSETRRGAVTALDWDVEPNADDPDVALAEAKADYCREKLNGIGNFADALDHLSDGIGPNVAVLELLWDKAELVGIVSVPGHRLTGDPDGLRPGVFVETDTSMGVPTSPGKWVVHHPQPNGGFPFRRTLTHATVFPWLMIHFTRVDWMSFSELYGNPIRVAKWTDDVVDDDRDAVATMLKEMGTDVAGSFPAGVDVELIQASGKGEIFVDQAEYAERKLSIAWLGQTLTTEHQGVGSFALGKVHDNVRSDLLAKDLKAEARTVEAQLLAPMVGLKFPNSPGPTPTWRRVIEEKRDFEAEKLGMEQLSKAIELGLPVKKDQAYEALAFERPTDGDVDVIGGTVPTAEGGNENAAT
jgi:phage gp29-like protein